MISNADLVHDLADVLHETRMRHLIDGALPVGTPSPLPTRRDREQAAEIVERLVELGVVGRRRGAASGDSTPLRTPALDRLAPVRRSATEASDARLGERLASSPPEEAECPVPP